MSTVRPVIEFLHTAPIHRETFEDLLKEHDRKVERRHEVRPDWLERARIEGLSGALSREIRGHLEAAAARSDVVVCTCSTLGPVADVLGRSRPHLFRIDRPMMNQAAHTEGTTLIAFCLESTLAPTTKLYESICREQACASGYLTIPCFRAWPRFEAGAFEEYGAEIAATVRGRLDELPDAGCIVLAQASMAFAEPFLADLPIPILSSPRLAASAALAMIWPPSTRTLPPA